MKFTTQTGSTYEVNQNKKQIRRLNGKLDPTPRQGKDGEWKTYDSVSSIDVGQSVMITWGNETPLLPGSEEGSTRTTITSAVASIEDVNLN